MFKDYNRQVLYLAENDEIRYINEFYSYLQLDDYTFVSIDYRNILNLIILDKIRKNFSYITISLDNLDKWLKPYYDFFAKNKVKFVSGIFGYLVNVVYDKKFIYISTSDGFVDYINYGKLFSNLDYSKIKYILNITDTVNVISINDYINNYHNNSIYFTYLSDKLSCNKNVFKEISSKNNLYFTYDFRENCNFPLKTKTIIDVEYDNSYDNFAKHFIYRYNIKTIEKRWVKMRETILDDFFTTIKNQSISYDDVSIQPYTLSNIKSRDDVNISKKITLNSNDEIYLDIPIFLSPMEYYNQETIKFINRYKKYEYHNDGIYIKLPIFPFLHRFGNLSNLKERIKVAEELKKEEMIFGLSLSLNELKNIIDKSDYKLLKHLVDVSDIILIDVANGYMLDLYKYADLFKQNISYVKIMLGNITGYFELDNNYINSFDYMRVGIASSPLCSTYVKTGIGVGMLTSIYTTYKMKKQQSGNFNIIADGGLKKFKDVFYSILFGADFIMSNTLFSYTELNINPVFHKDGKFYKEVYGMASKKVNNKKYIEGVVKYTEIPFDAIEYVLEYRNKTLFDYVIENIKTSLKSSLSYIGVKDINNIDESVFKVYLNSSNTIFEKSI